MTTKELLDQALVDRDESRWKTIAFVHRHEISAALATPPAPVEQDVERLRRVLEPFAQLARRKANYVIRPNDPIVLEAVRALAK